MVVKAQVIKTVFNAYPNFLKEMAIVKGFAQRLAIY